MNSPLVSTPCIRSQAKQTRLSFPKSDTIDSACFDLLHSDVWGPYCFKCACGASYFLTIVDDLSRYV